MSTPIGHTLFGLTLARRLGMRSPWGMAVATVAASLPDIDTIYSKIVHDDAWKAHRKGTHTLGFAVTAGMLAGFAGIISAGSAEGERDLVADGLTGAVLVGSHILLDNMPFPYRDLKGVPPPRTIGKVPAVNWLIDLVVYGAIAWKLWGREARA